MAAHKGNKYALGCTTNGRPPKFETQAEIEKVIQSYFDYCIKDKEKPTITGLTLYLGFESRSSLDDYCGRTKDYSYIIKRAKLAIENAYEIHGQTIDIFALKNMGWRDNKDIDLKDDRLILDPSQREQRIKELKEKLGMNESD